jgi:hypothetical protein
MYLDERCTVHSILVTCVLSSKVTVTYNITERHKESNDQVLGTTLCGNKCVTTHHE